MTHRLLLVGVLAAGLMLGGDSGVASTGAHAAFPGSALLFSGPPLPDGRQTEYAVNANGSRLRRLPVSGLLSPDGALMAFVRCRTDCLHAETGLKIDDLYVSRVDGTRARRVGTWKEAEATGGIAWAPDSRRLAYAEGLASWVRIVDVRTGRLLQQIDGVEDPAWSPNGRRLAASGPGFRGGVYTLRPDGSDRRRIADSYYPSWSPDSRWLVLVEDDALRRVRADGRRGEVILREADLPGATESASLTAHPVWSPRGDWIAFIASPASGDWAVYLVRPDGSRLRRVLALGRWGFRVDAVAWSPDGRHLAATVVDSLYSNSIAISDVVVVEVASGKSRRVTRGWRYGSENVALQWHPRGLPTSRVPGTPTAWTLPSDTIVEPTMLETTRVVDRLAADSSHVAFTFVPPTYSGYRGRALYRSSGLNCAELWEPGAAPIRLREPCSGTPWGPQGIAVAGEHVAWVESLLGPNAGSNSFSVYAGTAALPAPRLLLQTGNDPTGDLLGDADLLVFATWARNGPCTGSGCYAGDRREGRLYRFDGRAATLIAASTGPLTPLSVDAGRILVDRGTGLLDLLSADGASRRTFQLNASLVRGARVQGRNLVVLTPSVVEVTDTETGSFLRRWLAPWDSARLEDVQDEIAVLVAGTEIHLLRLSDGLEATIEVPGRGPVRAQLEPDGLFYSFGVDDPKYPGRVAFLPIDQLPLR